MPFYILFLKKNQQQIGKPLLKKGNILINLEKNENK